jgi:hypothetical protein
MTTNTEEPLKFGELPRPLNYVRPRLYMDWFTYMRNLFADEQVAELERLADLRRQGKPESDDDIVEIRENLECLANLLRECARAEMEFVGPGGLKP